MSESQLRSALLSLQSFSPDIQAAAIVSTDGLVIASALSEDMDEDSVGAMATAMLNFGSRISDELSRGALEQVVIKGQLGYILLTYLNPEATLCIITNGDIKLGMVLMASTKCAQAIQAVLG